WLTQGPQFETPAEIDAIEQLGGEVVGMTMPREAKLAAELGLPYVALCIAANWAAGRSPEGRRTDLVHEEISAEAHRRLGPVWAVLLDQIGA
ncbi:MAG: 5'-methylthioadenosine phosphorylase, partial [Candidatus Thermoplasmatota archaeon]|nr:5'-methylthioadenosine phosphorylase [Candidatus Thermoplasmatota archaeon]